MINFEVFVAVGAVIFLFYVYRRLARTSITEVDLIPGPRPADKLKGNGEEIKSFGSMHEFLEKYHRKYGPIISFWIGPKVFVSIASWKLFQEHSAPFDRPDEVFDFLVPLVGKDTIQFAKGDIGRRRHTAYSKSFGLYSVKKFYKVFNKIGKDMVGRWSSSQKGERILLQEEMFHVAIRSILISMFGEEFENEELVAKVKAIYDFCFGEMEKFALGHELVPGSATEVEFQIKKKSLDDIIRGIISRRRKVLHLTEEKLPVDAVLELELTESETVSDLVTLLIGGFHTTALLLTWCIYFLATHQDVQEKVRAEVSEVLGSSDQLTAEMAGQLKYLQQVLKETLRAAIIGPVSARVHHRDMILGGYKVPAETPVIHALGVTFYDETVFSEPHKFDPDRFSPENEKLLPPFSFEPFGFAGKRKCPAYNFSFTEANVFLPLIIRSVNIKVADDQVAEPQFGFVTRIKNDLWIIANPL